MAERLVRFSVTMSEELLEEFELRLRQMGKANRSEVIRGLVRRYVTEKRWQEQDGEVYGTVTLVYDHHHSWITQKLTALQHEHGDAILCTTHVHISHDTCLECIILKGKSPEIESFVIALETIRGLKSIEMAVSSET